MHYKHRYFHQKSQNYPILISFDIYQGKNPKGNCEYEAFRKCAAPVVLMIDEVLDDMKKLSYQIYFDNLFIGMRSFSHLKNGGYGATSKIVKIMSQKIAFPPLSRR